jgi:hypothetical protein
MVQKVLRPFCHELYGAESFNHSAMNSWQKVSGTHSAMNSQLKKFSDHSAMNYW